MKKGLFKAYIIVVKKAPKFVNMLIGNLTWIL